MVSEIHGIMRCYIVTYFAYVTTLALSRSSVIAASNWTMSSSEPMLCDCGPSTVLEAEDF